MINILKNCCFAVVVVSVIHVVTGLYEFPKIKLDIPQNELVLLDRITENDLRIFVDQGIQSVRKELRLEENLMNSAITVQNGSLSHKQLLETLPNARANEDSEVALRILRSSLYAYNAKCIDNNISAQNCRAFLSKQSLPKNTELWEDCNRVISGQREGHQVFRRLLTSNYQDGFYRMFSETKIPSPRWISSVTLHGQAENVAIGNEALDENQYSLAFVQWAQFIEHDISKPVVTSMKNGAPIECCHHDNYKLAPRFQHPACAPLIDKNHQQKHERETCLNYVRSALAVGYTCNFSGAEQLNQVSGYLDLSQLYGATKDAEQIMRTHMFGQIRSSQTSFRPEQQFLPLETSTPQAYCAFEPGANNESCFMAGDSRVNSNPLSIVLYTIFMRSHNRIASNLHVQNAEWDDDRLYKTAKSINIHLYRRIVFEEWLPCVLGQQLANEINSITLLHDVEISSLQISNEFAVAAARFYLSMLPNILHNVTEKPIDKSGSGNNWAIDNSVLTTQINSKNVSLDEKMHRSSILKDTNELNKFLDFILRQRALRMDGYYAETLIATFMDSNKLTRIDALAFDIQRGRDHGLQGYVKYLEVCQGVLIKGWDDLKNYIANTDIQRLQTIYENLNEVDLIVGGILENPMSGSTVGPTFTCILAEQFSKMQQWHQILNDKSSRDLSDEYYYRNWTGAELLCANSQLKTVPRNIFKTSSESNPSIHCASII